MEICLFIAAAIVSIMIFVITRGIAYALSCMIVVNSGGTVGEVIADCQNICLIIVMFIGINILLAKIYDD